jgi:hypothetical protein
MEQKKRLVDLIKKSRREWLEKEYDNETEKSVDEYVADYLIANNVVVLPCRVGDTVYSLLYWWDKDSGIVPYQIKNLTMTQNQKGEWTKKYRAMQLKNGKTIDWQLNFDFDMLGKTVFLSREEAEAKLREMRDGT